MCWACERCTGWPVRGAVWPQAFSARKPLGALAGVSFASQLVGTLAGCGFALISGFIVYGGLKAFMGIRMSEEEEQAVPTSPSIKNRGTSGSRYFPIAPTPS